MVDINSAALVRKPFLDECQIGPKDTERMSFFERRVVEDHMYAGHDRGIEDSDTIACQEQNSWVVLKNAQEHWR